jgi:hypothetical protein
MISACTFGITALAMVMVYPFGNRGIVAGGIWQECAQLHIEGIFVARDALTELDGPSSPAPTTIEGESPRQEKP